MTLLVQLQKRTMALAGMIMAVYLIFHLISNLSFFSPASFNQFHAWYDSSLVRDFILILFLAALFIHIKFAINIRIKNAKARDIAYKKHDHLEIPAFMVSVSLLFILVFILIHIVQMRQLAGQNTYLALQHLFQSNGFLLFYLAGLLVMFMHFAHALHNVLQTLAITSKSYALLVYLISLFIFIGFASIPLNIYWTAL